MIQDLRQQGKVLHNLMDVMFIAVAAFIAGADDWEIVILFAEQHLDWHLESLNYKTLKKQQVLVSPCCSSILNYYLRQMFKVPCPK